jgi:HlyD family secretion protein
MKQEIYHNNKVPMLIAICILMSGLFLGCTNADNPTDVAPRNQDPLLVQEISASGEVVPVNWVTISYPSGATDLAFKVAVGDEVSKNEVLVTSNNPQLMSALFQAQSALARSQAGYDQITQAPSSADLAMARAAVANAKANLARVELQSSLDEVIEAAEADVEAAEQNLQKLQTTRASQIEIEAAENDIRAAEWALKQAEEAFDLTAPFTGTIVEIYAKTGESIGAGQPLLILADLSEFQVVTTDLSEIDITRVSVGQEAEIVFDAISDQTFMGTVTKIADKSSGTSSVYYEVTLSLNDMPKGLRWGMTAYVIFPVD